MTTPSPAAKARTSALLVVHAGAVTVLIGILAILGWATGVDASENFGAGFVGLILGLLGLPWSLPALAVDSPTAGGLIVAVAATANVGVHAAIRAIRGRSATGAVPAPDPEQRDRPGGRPKL